jgi:hypothetical protein
MAYSPKRPVSCTVVRSPGCLTLIPIEYLQDLLVVVVRVLERAVENYRREQFYAEFNAAFERLRSDPVAWKDYLAEQAEMHLAFEVLDSADALAERMREDVSES